MAGIYGVPRVPARAVERSRLIARLDSAEPLHIVRGAPGTGKTVLLAQWARATERRGVWVNLDAATASSLALWRVVLRALADAGLDAEDAIVAESLENAIADLETAPDIRRLLERAFTRVGDVTLVLDSFESVTDAAVAVDLAWLVEHCAGLRAVVATRERGPLESGQVVVAVDTVVVVAPELAFTTEETARAIELAIGRSPQEALVRQVLTATNGVPVVVRVATLALVRSGAVDDADGAFLAAGAVAMLEVIEAQVNDDELMHALLRVSLVDRLTPELVVELGAGREVIEYAERNAIGVRGEDGSFTLTPLVRDALRAELHRRYPGEPVELHRAAASWLVAQNAPFAAFAHAVASDDLELVSAIVARFWLALLAFHLDDVVDTLGRVSLVRLRKYPLVAAILALAYNARGTSQVRGLELFALTIAGARMQGSKAKPNERALLLTIESAALRVIGRNEGAASAASKAIDAIAALDEEHRDLVSTNLASMHTHIGISLLYVGDYERALASFSLALAAGTTIADVSWVHPFSLLAGTHALRGDMIEAAQLVEEARSLPWRPSVRDGYGGSFYHVGEAMLALESFDYDAAQEHVSVLAPHLETIEHWPVLVHLQAMIDLGRGRGLEGHTSLTAALNRRKRASVTSFTRPRLDADRALLLLSIGRSAEAEALLRKHPPSSSAIALAWGRRHLLAGEAEQSLAAMDALRDWGIQTPRHQAEVGMLRAAALARLGRPVGGTVLDRAIALLDDRGLRFPLALVPLPDLHRLLESSSAGSRAAELLADHLDRHGDAASFFSRPISSIVLTRREHVVLAELVRSANVAEIAATLFVSPNTVKSQLRGLYRKLGVNSREEAVVAALEHGLIDS